jgi:hypothetical protein
MIESAPAIRRELDRIIAVLTFAPPDGSHFCDVAEHCNVLEPPAPLCALHQRAPPRSMTPLVI